MKALFPLILGIIGLVGGAGAGIFLKPAPEITEEDQKAAEKPKEEEKDSDTAEGADYVKMNNQFIVPLVEAGNVRSLIVMSLSLEVDTGSTETVYDKEPKLRDAFLQVLFDHANAGGFSGAFTKSTNMMVLRDSLLETARRTLGDIVTDVLIVDLVRQDT